MRLATLLKKNTHTQSGGSYEIERTKSKISIMTSVGDLKSAIQHLIIFILRENRLVQICPLVRFHNFHLVLPSVAHPRSFGLIKHMAI